MLVEVPAEEFYWLNTPGFFFDCKSASKPFELEVYEANGTKHDLSIDEGDSFELNGGRAFVRMRINNRSNTDKLSLSVNITDFPVRSMMTRVPPTSLRTSGVLTLAAVNDESAEFEGIRNGKRRKQITVQMVSDDDIDIMNDDEVVFRLSSTVPTWTMETDANIKLKLSGGANGGYIVSETFHL